MGERLSGQGKEEMKNEKGHHFLDSGQEKNTNKSEGGGHTGCIHPYEKKESIPIAHSAENREEKKKKKGEKRCTT